MKKSKQQEKFEGLIKFLRLFTKNENFIIQKSDGRLGTKIAIAEKLEYGAIDVKTKFMTYDEMDCFFMGMMVMKENRINF